MKRIFLFGLSLFLACFFTACQRFEKTEDQTGLDKDSHSYTHMGYPESKMKQVALSVPGVRDVRMEYNGEKIMMYIVPEGDFPRSRYHDLVDLIQKRLRSAAPINPVHIKIIKPDEWLHQE
ncbi:MULTISPECIES: hypothetical protein [Thermoactinomyces]|jgi:hypothetical protein|uniref:Lipoprotein n=1 Tax=Thermoactinomyces daqus TaxID=1329516 RepID=A0A7W2AHA9_9BACL|nr:MULTISPECIES: hypothetical protein [Thermoactinomyces]MBA4543042.1 hypothetical protein [Thermoactinomyces daqus]MBH8598703.1 hypothetical protein [Thermoactinomyces sp. CICC 10523]MBH8605038.1 hypothetical protein [Thermoactinomyces sp. CICC 10522]MBH8606294.1 hypothetical protein [Thermoactinomyces sp. CICC 10521]